MDEYAARKQGTLYGFIIVGKVSAVFCSSTGELCHNLVVVTELKCEFQGGKCVCVCGGGGGGRGRGEGGII